MRRGTCLGGVARGLRRNNTVKSCNDHDVAGSHQDMHGAEIIPWQRRNEHDHASSSPFFYLYQIGTKNVAGPFRWHWSSKVASCKIVIHERTVRY